MSEDLNLSCSAYRFSCDNSNNYTFVTDDLRVYEVYFIESDFDGIPIVIFGFDRKSGKKKADIRVQLTIRDIFLDFCSRNREPIFFVCSSAGNSAKSRFSLFDQWFNKYGEGFVRKDYCVEDFYSAVIISKTHSDKDNIIASLNVYFDGFGIK